MKREIEVLFENYYNEKKISGAGLVKENSNTIFAHAYGYSGVAGMFAYYPTIDTTSIILGNQTCNIWELHWKVEQIILKN